MNDTVITTIISLNILCLLITLRANKRTSTLTQILVQESEWMKQSLEASKSHYQNVLIHANEKRSILKLLHKISDPNYVKENLGKTFKKEDSKLLINEELHEARQKINQESIESLNDLAKRISQTNEKNELAKRNGNRII